MKLLPPFEISYRLLPALRVPCRTGEVRDAWLSLECVGCRGHKMVYKWHADLPDGTEHEAADLYSPPRGSDAETDQEAFGALLNFLTAAAESYRYRGKDWDNVGEDDSATLFPRAVVEWAYCHQDELEMLREEIESEENRSKLLTE